VASSQLPLPPQAPQACRVLDNQLAKMRDTRTATPKPNCNPGAKPTVRKANITRVVLGSLTKQGIAHVTSRVLSTSYSTCRIAGLGWSRAAGHLGAVCRLWRRLAPKLSTI
jgi:hypothetical protein